MLLARFNSNQQQALAFARRSATYLEKFAAGVHDRAEAPAILLTHLNVADPYMLAGELEDAQRLCDRGRDLARTLDNRLYAGTFLWVSGEISRREGELDEALKQMEESVRILKPLPTGAEHGRTMNFIMALIHEGQVLGEEDAISLGESEAAADRFQLAFETADKFVHQDLQDQASRGRLASAGIKLADILRRSNPSRALATYDHVLRHSSEIDNPSFARYQITALAGSSTALLRLHRVREARRRLDTAFERLRQMNLYPADKIKLGSEADLTLSAFAD